MADTVGNLFRTKNLADRVYGKNGQLLESRGKKGTTYYRYDAEGNLTQKLDATGKVWKYEWNAAGTLKHVTRPDGKTVTFTYDAFGRRISKSYNEKTICWLWDDDVPIHEWTAENNPGAMTWLFDPLSYTPFAKITGNQAYSIITDHLGTPTLMLDSRGQEVWAAELDIYGRVQEQTLTGNHNDCPFRFPGQYEDEETGLYYNFFRYYDPGSGEYISQDPIAMEGGSHLYRYVRDPSTWIDPFGLRETGPFQFKEGQVMTYREYQNRCNRNRTYGRTNDFEGHHIPSSKKLEQAGIDKKDGTVVVMKKDRHRSTRTYGRSNQDCPPKSLQEAQEADLNDDAMKGLGGSTGTIAEQVRTMNRTNHPGHFT